MKKHQWTAIALLLFACLPAKAQLSSESYQSPLNGAASSGALLQSAHYASSGTVTWYDCSVVYSANYRAVGLGNAEILNGDVTSGEEQQANNSGCIVFPNPIAESSALSFVLKIGGNLQLTVVDAAGATAFSWSPGYRSAGQHSIPLGQLFHAAAGVYMLRLEAGTQIETARIIQY